MWLCTWSNISTPGSRSWKYSHMKLKYVQITLGKHEGKRYPHCWKVLSSSEIAGELLLDDSQRGMTSLAGRIYKPNVLHKNWIVVINLNMYVLHKNWIVVVNLNMYVLHKNWIVVVNLNMYVLHKNWIVVVNLNMYVLHKNWIVVVNLNMYVLHKNWIVVVNLNMYVLHKGAAHLLSMFSYLLSPSPDGESSRKTRLCKIDIRQTTTFSKWRSHIWQSRPFCYGVMPASH